MLSGPYNCDQLNEIHGLGTLVAKVEAGEGGGISKHVNMKGSTRRSCCEVTDKFGIN